jgi:uncharacterized protein (DUF2384 family)
MPQKPARAPRKSQSRKVVTLPVERVTLQPQAGSLYEPTDQVERVVTALGSNSVARILGVSRSQPSRWRTGEEQVSPANRARLADLDHVLDRLLQLLWPEEAAEWLTARNPHLNGRPIDVLAMRGSAPVIEAIDALAQGSYA